MSAELYDKGRDSGRLEAISTVVDEVNAHITTSGTIDPDQFRAWLWAYYVTSGGFDNVQS